jgi:hypothetical protein
MKHILTILIMMLALGSYASELSVTDSISSAEKVDTMALRAGKSWVNRILDYPVVHITIFKRNHLSLSLNGKARQGSNRHNDA